MKSRDGWLARLEVLAACPLALCLAVVCLTWAACLPLTAVAQESTDDAPTDVGMVGSLEQVVLAGSELEATPLEDHQSPIVLRVVEVYPHGSDFRYDLEYYGLEPGSYNLVDYLRRKDGSSTADLDPLTVTITNILPEGIARPNELPPRQLPRLGGYRMWWVLGGLLWLAGVFVILFAWRGSKKTSAEKQAQEASLADRLRPLVGKAQQGELTTGERAELERMLLAYWRRRLQIEDQPAAEAIQTLRAHDDAGALLKQLDEWLHRPGPAGDVDVAVLLRPYEQVKASELDEPITVAAGEKPA